jgi:hypothetical protein
MNRTQESLPASLSWHVSQIRTRSLDPLESYSIENLAEHHLERLPHPDALYVPSQVSHRLSTKPLTHWKCLKPERVLNKRTFGT